MALPMLLGLFTQNTALYLTLAIGQFFGYMAQNRNLTYLVSRAGWLDIQRVFRGRQPLRDLNPGIGGFLSLGLCLGSVFLALIPIASLRLFSILLFIAFVGLGVLTLAGKTTPKAIAGFLVFVAVNLVWFRLFGRSLADDGGYDELGGDLRNVVRDPAGRIVLNSGVQPGLLGSLGAMLGTVLNTAYEAGAAVGGKVVDGVKYVGGKVVDGVTYVGGKVVDGATYVGGKVVDGVTYVGETAVGVYQGTKQIVTDLQNPEIWDGMWEGIEKDVTQAGKDFDQAWQTAKDVAGKAADAVVDGIKDAVLDVWNNPGVYLDTLINGTIGTIKDTASLTWEVLSNPQIILDTAVGSIKDLGGALWTGTKIAGNVIAAIGNGLYTAVTDPAKAWTFIKDMVGIDNFKNAFDPNRGLWDRAGQIILGTVKVYGTITGAQAIYQTGAKVAATGVTQTVKTLWDDAAKLLGGKGGATPRPGTPLFTTKGPAYTGNLNQQQLKTFQDLVAKHGLDDATIRIGGNRSIMEQMTKGHVLPKGHDIMNKTVSAIDEAWLGGPTGAIGLAAHFKPTLPPAEELSKMGPKTLDKVWNRYLQRYDEYLSQKANIENLVKQGKITLDPSGLIRDKLTGKPFGSDWDLFNLLKGGNQLPKAAHDAFIQDCIKAGLPVRHGSLIDWANLSDFQKEAYGKMIRSAMKEGVISVGPTGSPTHKILNTFIKAAAQP